MELKVYDWEFFERGIKRFLIFGFVILLVVVLSILWSNIIWWVFVLMVSGGYIYYLTKSNNTIKMVTWKKALQIWKITFPWSELVGFVLEYHTKKKKIHNIVIIDNKKVARIYTIKDTEKNLEKFVNELNGYIPMLEKYDQTSFEKFIRRLKL